MTNATIRQSTRRLLQPNYLDDTSTNWQVWYCERFQKSEIQGPSNGGSNFAYYHRNVDLDRIRHISAVSTSRRRANPDHRDCIVNMDGTNQCSALVVPTRPTWADEGKLMIKQYTHSHLECVGDVRRKWLGTVSSGVETHPWRCPNQHCYHIIQSCRAVTQTSNKLGPCQPDPSGLMKADP